MFYKMHITIRIFKCLKISQVNLFTFRHPQSFNSNIIAFYTIIPEVVSARRYLLPKKRIAYCRLVDRQQAKHLRDIFIWAATMITLDCSGLECDTKLLFESSWMIANEYC